MSSGLDSGLFSGGGIGDHRPIDDDGEVAHQVASGLG
jgi:hypothetical protein